MTLPKLDTGADTGGDDKSSAPRSYRRRPNPKATERLRRENIAFMLTLSQTEPQTLLAAAQPWDLLKLCAGLCERRIFWEPSKTTRRGAEWLAQESEWLAQRFRAEPDALKELIEELRKFFDAVADGGRCEIRFMSGSAFVLKAAAPEAPRQRPFSFETPAGRDGFIQSVVLGAALYVAWSPEAMVRRCAREACRRVFLATRPKQIFCSRRCASAAVFERYKKKLGEEEYRARHTALAAKNRRRKAKREALRRKGK